VRIAARKNNVAQLFGQKADLIFKVAILLVLALAALSIALGYAWSYSEFSTGEDMRVEQPVPFSHKHHVGELGIDCRYCHAYVESSAYAGIPASSTCMKCHSQIWPQSEMLAPVRESYDHGTALAWVKVNDLPDFVYFNHSIHVAKGIGCESCHGRVDQMPLMRKAATYHMEWCLDCHRDPEKHIRPREEITTMGWQRPDNDPEFAERLMHSYQVKSRTDCSTCHR
jgi:hypothetical protein